MTTTHALAGAAAAPIATTKPDNYVREKEKIKEFLSTFYLDELDGTENIADDAADSDDRKTFPYTDQLKCIAERQQTAIYIDLDHVQIYDPELVVSIQQNARRYHQLFSDVIDDIVHDILGDREPPVRDALDAFIYQRVYMAKLQNNADGSLMSKADLRKQYPPHEIYFKRRQTDKLLSVREVKAAHIGKLVSVSGVVMRCTEVKPMSAVITYTCDTCGCETYQPVNGPSFVPAVNCPSKDCVESKANGRLQMQIRGSKFIKFQEIKIQEESNDVPVGSIPRSLTITMCGENTRLAVPGDAVQITGVFLPLLKTGFRQMAAGLLSDVFIDAHHIENGNKGDEDVLGVDEVLTDEEVTLVSQDNFYDLLAYSIAPEIYGHVDVKKSLLLALVSGVDKNAAGMKIRGAINILLMGDPGVAKSQLLSHIDRLAIRSQYTTGRGSSGVGLTAAVMRDPLTGEMTLEGGALVLADRGICCIDEFDKMMEGDRTAIHEVMEQQTISIAKAGIMTTLNARVSIIAAANPAYGRYNPKRSIEQNIELPAALLSRFDLLWLIQDKPDRESDKRLADHITYVHMEGHERAKEGMKPLEMRLIRRYIALCKRKHPTVPETLANRLVQMYVELRKDARNNRDTTFTSPRTLLAVVRMSTALARLRLGDVVNTADIDEAIRLMETSKESLRPQQHIATKLQNPVDQAFAIIRDMYQKRVGAGAEDDNDRSIPMAAAQKKCVSKGIDETVLDECIQVYTNNGVLMVDRHDRIIFTMT